LIKECLTECCKYAEEYGVYMALQNHAPITATWYDVYRMIREIDNPWLKICYDINTQNDDKDIIDKSTAAIGDLDIHFHFNGEWERAANGELVGKYVMGHDPLANYDYFVKKKIENGYKGYLAYEFCHTPMLNSVPQGIGYVDEQCAFALELLRKWIAESAV